MSPVIAARRVRVRVPRICPHCYKRIGRGETAIRLYGSAEPSDPKYTLYLHPGCIYPDQPARNPKVAAALRAPAAPPDAPESHTTGAT